MHEEEQDRTEQATAFKLEEAQKRGDVARSPDVASFALVAALLVTLLAAGASAWTSLCRTSELLLDSAASGDSLALLGELGRQWLHLTLPFGLVGICVAIAATLLQTGPVFSFKPVTPRFDRINPVQGFQRLFSRRMLVEAVKSVAKLSLLGGVAYTFFESSWAGLMGILGAAPDEQLRFLSERGSALLLRLGGALLVVALIDWGIVRLQFRRRMMMSRRELKEEIRRREGDPHIRARLRELQRENLEQARALGRVPDADVLITNPDHFAIALQYIRGQMSAPHVIAKGTGMWVDRIREVARQHGIPVLERPPLARHLYRRGVVDLPVPVDTYVEVARVYSELGARPIRTARYEVSR